jgi:hypothetical protein
MGAVSWNRWSSWPHAVNARTIQLLDRPKLIDHLSSLECTAGGGGRDRVDHGPYAGAHDDVAAVCAGLNYIAGVSRDRHGVVLAGAIEKDGDISWVDERAGRPRFRIMPRSALSLRREFIDSRWRRQPIRRDGFCSLFSTSETAANDCR